MNWASFRQEAPELAGKGSASFSEHLLGLLGTIRKDGSPRVCPIEVLLAGDELCMGMAPSSKKALDLKRDPRCTVHTIATHRKGDDIEFKANGRALEIEDPATFEAFADVMQEKVGWRPKLKQGFFVTLDIESASFIHSPSQTLLVWSATGGYRKGKPA